MKVFCTYNKDYDIFLKTLVEYVLRKYKDELNISEIEEIELVRKIEGFEDSDGRYITSERKILLSERKYRELSCFDIEQIETTESFKSIVSTIYHEMGHATDKKLMPGMYAYLTNAEDITSEVVATFLFLEYVAERRTEGIATGEYPIFCEQIVSGQWNRYGEYNDPFTAFLYLSKLAVYFIIKAEFLQKMAYYLKKINDSLFSDYIVSLNRAFKAVYARLPFDDHNQCSEIEKVIKQFLPAFEDEYVVKKR